MRLQRRRSGKSGTTDPRWRRRAVAAAILGALALPALAFLPPGSAILRRAVQKREEVGLGALEARGTLGLAGEAAGQVAAAIGAPAAPQLSARSVLMVKSPGRCRLELSPERAAAVRPAVSARGGRVVAAGGLESAPAVRALVEGVCTLLGGAGGLGQRLAGHGVALGDVALGRMGGRVAWVLGGRPLSGRPQGWVDKQSFQPIRLVAPLAGAPRDVRLVDFGSSVGGEVFPQAVEVWSGGQLEVRFTLEKLVPNPKLPDALF